MFGGLVGAGTFLAFALSWFEHESLPWAIVHAIYSWFYVAYYALTKSGTMAPIDASPTMSLLAVSLAVIVSMIAFAGIIMRRSR